MDEEVWIKREVDWDSSSKMLFFKIIMVVFKSWKEDKEPFKFLKYRIVKNLSNKGTEKDVQCRKDLAR